MAADKMCRGFFLLLFFVRGDATRREPGKQEPDCRSAQRPSGSAGATAPVQSAALCTRNPDLCKGAHVYREVVPHVKMEAGHY